MTKAPDHGTECKQLQSLGKFGRGSSPKKATPQGIEPHGAVQIQWRGHYVERSRNAMGRLEIKSLKCIEMSSHQSGSSGMPRSSQIQILRFRQWSSVSRRFMKILEWTCTWLVNNIYKPCRTMDPRSRPFTCRSMVQSANLGETCAPTACQWNIHETIPMQTKYRQVIHLTPKHSQTILNPHPLPQHKPTGSTGPTAPTEHPLQAVQGHGAHAITSPALVSAVRE